MASSSREAGGHSLLVSCICRFNSFQRPPLFSRLTPNFEFYYLEFVLLGGSVVLPMREGHGRRQMSPGLASACPQRLAQMLERDITALSRAGGDR